MTHPAVQGRCLDSLVPAEVRHARAHCMPGHPAPPVRRGVRRLLQRAPTAALRDRAAGVVAVPRAAHAAGLRRQVAGGRSVAALSRFLSAAPWSAEEVAATWRARFDEQVAPAV